MEGNHGDSIIYDFVKQKAKVTQNYTHPNTTFTDTQMYASTHAHTLTN